MTVLGCGGHSLDTHRCQDGDLAVMISEMSEAEICHFIRHESKFGRLSRTIRQLNRDVLSKDTTRRYSAEEAIRRLGFI